MGIDIDVVLPCRLRDGDVPDLISLPLIALGLDNLAATDRFQGNLFGLLLVDGFAWGQVPDDAEDRAGVGVDPDLVVTLGSGDVHRPDQLTCLLFEVRLINYATA